MAKTNGVSKVTMQQCTTKNSHQHPIYIVLYCFGSYPILVMGVVPSLMGNVCVYVCM